MSRSEKDLAENQRRIMSEACGRGWLRTNYFWPGKVVAGAIFFAACLECFSPPADASAFDEIRLGARAVGMGGAQTAAVEDANSVYWNPAGLAGLRRPQAAFSHLDLQSLGLIIYDQFTYAQPFVFNNAIGFSWQRMGTTGRVNFLNYVENTFILAYEQPVFSGFSLGINAKIFEVQYQQTAGGWGLDIGLLYRIFPELLIGGVWENANRPEIQWITGAVDRVPSNLKLGVAAHPEKETTLAVDGEHLLESSPGIHFGAERWFFNYVLAVRAGVVYDTLEKHFSPAGGLGLRIAFLELGYAYSSHIDLDGNHVLSLNWGF